MLISLGVLAVSLVTASLAQLTPPQATCEDGEPGLLETLTTAPKPEAIDPSQAASLIERAQSWVHPISVEMHAPQQGRLLATQIYFGGDPVNGYELVVKRFHAADFTPAGETVFKVFPVKVTGRHLILSLMDDPKNPFKGQTLGIEKTGNGFRLYTEDSLCELNGTYVRSPVLQGRALTFSRGKLFEPAQAGNLNYGGGLWGHTAKNASPKDVAEELIRFAGDYAAESRSADFQAEFRAALSTQKSALQDKVDEEAALRSRTAVAALLLAAAKQGVSHLTEASKSAAQRANEQAKSSDEKLNRLAADEKIVSQAIDAQLKEAADKVKEIEAYHAKDLAFDRAHPQEGLLGRFGMSLGSGAALKIAKDKLKQTEQKSFKHQQQITSDIAQTQKEGRLSRLSATLASASGGVLEVAASAVDAGARKVNEDLSQMQKSKTPGHLAHVEKVLNRYPNPVLQQGQETDSGSYGSHDEGQAVTLFKRGDRLYVGHWRKRAYSHQFEYLGKAELVAEGNVLALVPDTRHLWQLPVLQGDSGADLKGLPSLEAVTKDLGAGLSALKDKVVSMKTVGELPDFDLIKASLIRQGLWREGSGGENALVIRAPTHSLARNGAVVGFVEVDSGRAFFSGLDPKVRNHLSDRYLNGGRALVVAHDDQGLKAISPVVVHELVHALDMTGGLPKWRGTNARAIMQERKRLESEFDRDLPRLVEFERETSEYQTELEKFLASQAYSQRDALAQKQTEKSKLFDSLRDAFEKKAFGDRLEALYAPGGKRADETPKWKERYIYLLTKAETLAWKAEISFKKHELGQTFEQILENDYLGIEAGRTDVKTSYAAWERALLKRWYDEG